MIYALLLLLWLPLSADAEDLIESQKCFFRCTAKCLGWPQNSTVQECQADCKDPQFCNTTDEYCLDSCNTSISTMPLERVSGLHTEEQNLTTVVVFPPVRNATLYVVQYKLSDEAIFSSQSYLISPQPTFTNSMRPKSIFCKPIDIRVAAVSPSQTGPFSEPISLGPPRPLISSELKLSKMVYLNTSINSDSAYNGTVEVTLKYTAGAWPLGLEDLDVTPAWYLFSCNKTGSDTSVPVPDFTQGPNPDTIVGRLEADVMYRECSYMYNAERVASRKCRTESAKMVLDKSVPPLEISCATVKNNPCVHVDYFPSPRCGQINTIDYEVTGRKPAPDRRNESLSLNITFDPIKPMRNEAPTNYYVAFYGDAQPHSKGRDDLFGSVNVTRITGNVTNCLKFDKLGYCLKSYNNSVSISGIHYDKTYGIIFCAVKDPRNLAFPELIGNSSVLLPKASKIFVSSKEKPSKAGLIIGIIGAAFILVMIITALSCYINKKQKQENKMYQLRLAQLEMEKETRYVNLPKQLDIWEIERRNLIIYDEVKLGSGAFGAVYLGRLIGNSPANHDSKSPLGVNLMRAENCQVAVKMLPEYADDATRSEFLREIGLMKTIGYHERLVNMLACITESEPLCLVAELCSDGDLLNFLRERCKYMIKLDMEGINYHDLPEDNNYNIEMVVTLKQLLMFAVQISYGLEYLTSKGFVHRDVAARNILVNGKNSCKIGDFGLCRNLYADSLLYKSKGGRLPLKWMSPEAIRRYEFSAQSDVWAFGVLLFEIITLGGSPYPLIPAECLLEFLESGGRIERPDNCPEDFYEVMLECWYFEPEKRPDFLTIRQRLAAQLEEITEEYNYLKLDGQKEYYNVQYAEKPDIMVIPETGESISPPNLRKALDTLSADSLPVDDITTWSGVTNAQTGDGTREGDSGAVSLAKGSDSDSCKDYSF
ncbi:unnamed protein product [Cylicocyclus nassatus]|uniref:Protein kinase domain-containing protein n=1 Tax=Cylicocyclus nassatus TaxID=53992 RepID=A0AA36GFF8_CYLNA|nr:unnamed protein product [Cylicocyclus nassatus]